MLTESNDAFGHALRDHFYGLESYEITERDDGYIQLEIGPEGYFRPFDRWSRIEKEASGYVKGRILDIGCGAGRHSLYFQERGHDVVGIDISPLAIEVCLKRGLLQARNISVTKINSSLGVFDTLLLLGGNFGLLGNYAGAKRLLARFTGITSPAGRIIATSTDPHQLGDDDLAAYMKLNIEKGRMPGQLRSRVRYKGFIAPWTDFLLVSKDEMRDILEGTDWNIGEFIDSGDARYTAIIEKVK